MSERLQLMRSCRGRSHASSRVIMSHGVQAPVVYQTPDHALYTNAFVRKNPNTTKYAAYNHERNRQIS